MKKKCNPVQFKTFISYSVSALCLYSRLDWAHDPALMSPDATTWMANISVWLNWPQTQSLIALSPNHILVLTFDPFTHLHTSPSQLIISFPIEEVQTLEPELSFPTPTQFSPSHSTSNLNHNIKTILSSKYNQKFTAPHHLLYGPTDHHYVSRVASNYSRHGNQNSPF